VFFSLDMYRNNFPHVQKDEALEELDWDDEPKVEVKTSKETKLVNRTNLDSNYKIECGRF
jgi:hypothetical protein